MAKERNPILPEDLPVWRLKDDILFGVAFLKLLSDLLFQVIFDVFGFPIAVGQIKAIHQRAVRIDVFLPMLQGILFVERPVELFRAMMQQIRKRRRDRAFFMGI